MKIKGMVPSESSIRKVIIEAKVVPDITRCVQCGICSYYCPVGIDVRRHAWLGQPILDSHCLTCGECIARCPRAVLVFEKTNIFLTRNEVGKKLSKGSDLSMVDDA